MKDSIDRVENSERFVPSLEIGNYKDVESLVIFFAVSKTLANDWGNEQDGKIAQGIKSQTVNLSEGSINLFNQIKNLVDNNEESLRWLALVVEKGDEAGLHIIDELVKHKGLKRPDAERALSEFKKFYQEIKEIFDLREVTNFITADIGQREEELPQLQMRINEAMNFFNPQTSHIDRIIYLPTNPLETKDSGGGISIGNSFYINAERGNKVNEIHEFLHSIINPMIEQINLDEAQSKKVLELCSSNLKYYKYPESVLTEAIIRTYHTGFRSENEPCLENFKRRILAADKTNLQAVLDQESQNGIAAATKVEELLASDDLIYKYYERYGRDLLAERIWKFFESYQASRVDSFERFFIDNYHSLLVSD